MGKLVADYEIVDHGLEHSQYFQGCGTTFTEYTDCYTGCGDNPREALEDALESAAQCDWDVDSIKNDLPETPSIAADVEQERQRLQESIAEEWNNDDPTIECMEDDPDFDLEEEVEKELEGYMDDCYYYVSIRLR